MGKLLYKMPEGAAQLELGLTKVYELVNSGQLRVVHVGRAVRIRADALREFVDNLQNAEDAR